MLRSFILEARKLLVVRSLPGHTLTSYAATSSLTAIYDVRRNPRVVQHPRYPFPLLCNSGHPLLGHSPLVTNIRCASKKSKSQIQVPDPALIACNLTNMLKCVDLNHMKDAPEPEFWAVMAYGGIQVFVPLLELIGGYCHTMTIFQLHAAAMMVATFSGIKWGLAISKNPVPAPSWDTMKWAATPAIIALLGLIVPYPLGFILVSGAMVSRLYLDLKSCAFSPPSNAIRLFITATTVVGLTMALLAYLLFDNKGSEPKNEEEKEPERKKKKNETEDEETQTDNKSNNNGK